MIEVELAPADLARVRFAHSPLRETIASLRVLRDPTRRPAYAQWLARVRGRLDGLDTALLLALAPPGPYAYSFLLPDLPHRSASIADELAAVMAATPDAIRRDIAAATRGRAIPGPLRPLYDDPAVGLPLVLDELDRYWHRAVAPFWPEIEALATADIFHRLEQFAGGGIAHVLHHLHPEVVYVDDRLFVSRPSVPGGRCDLTGRGLALVPCVFGWPSLVVHCGEGVQPSLQYPTRGVAGIGATASYLDDPPALTVGRTKMSLLALLEQPRTTTQLARELSISPAAVSQHLQVLRASDMAISRRKGRFVLYQRTAAATALLSSIRTPVIYRPDVPAPVPASGRGR